jgi:ketosteroid isomerase-like protein
MSMETDRASELYEAFAARDASTLLGTLHAEFRGVVSEGMPAGVGGVHVGPEAMLRDCWARIFEHYDISPVPDELAPLADGRLLVLGRYRGPARATGREPNAVFAHVLHFRDGLVDELVQITDTASWHAALEPAPSEPR